MLVPEPPAGSFADIDALMVLSFGGPEGPDEVMPFLRHVVAGRGVPDDRLAAVAEQYTHFGGISPLNEENRDLVRRLLDQAPDHWKGERVYLANRNSAPFVADTVAQMAADGITRAGVFITSPFSSYSGCRQYRENLAAAEVSAGVQLQWRVIPRFWDHPLFTQIWADRIVWAAPAAADVVVFVTHSLPVSMGQRYLDQHERIAASIMAAAGPAMGTQPDWELAFQSRSGPPEQPWLEPDISEVIERLGRNGVQRVIVAPLGFCSENLEIGWDLDVTAAKTAADLGVQMDRLAPPQRDHRFADLVWDLLVGPGNRCAADCCLHPRTRLPAVGDAPALV